MYKLLYEDKDSIFYEINDINPDEEIIKKHLDKCDTSDYPTDNR